MKQTHALNLRDYLSVLGNSSDHGQLFAQASYLATIQKRLLITLPAQFRNQCAVGQHTADGLLVIYTNSAAIATRLRNLAPSIQQKMNKAGINVEHIKFSIQPQLRPLLSDNNAREVNRSLSQAAIEQLTRLSDSLSAESPLKHALKTLLTNNLDK